MTVTHFSILLAEGIIFFHLSIAGVVALVGTLRHIGITFFVSGYLIAHMTSKTVHIRC